MIENRKIKLANNLSSVIEKTFIILGVFSERLMKIKCGRGQVDSPELPETLAITESTENFTKVTKYLNKFKETLINYVLEKSHVKKQ